jgi:hypothetical protein
MSIISTERVTIDNICTYSVCSSSLSGQDHGLNYICVTMAPEIKTISGNGLKTTGNFQRPTQTAHSSFCDKLSKPVYRW